MKDSISKRKMFGNEIILIRKYICLFIFKADEDIFRGGSKMQNAWRDFQGGSWEREINVRDFIQKNYHPYDGDESFLAGPTQDTKDLWEQVLELSKQEREAGGVLDMDTKIISTILSHGPGYLNKEKEKIELDFLDSKMEKQQFDVYDFKNKVEKKEREISDILISKEKNKRNSVGSFQRRKREKYWYPDFIEEKDETQRRNIMDAKYKHWNFNNEDMHQMLSYLYITGGKRCGIVFPTNEQIDVKYLILNPYVGFYADEAKEEIRCYQLPFIIPIYEENYKKEQEKECKSEAYRNFCKKIEESCNIWKKQFEEYFLNCK